MSFSKEQIEALIVEAEKNYMGYVTQKLIDVCKQLLEVMEELEELRHT